MINVIEVIVNIQPKDNGILFVLKTEASELNCFCMPFIRSVTKTVLHKDPFKSWFENNFESLLDNLVLYAQKS